MKTYTLTVNEQQKDMLVDALRVYSQLWAGQTLDAKLTASKLKAAVDNVSHIGAADLSRRD